MKFKIIDPPIEMILLSYEEGTMRGIRIGRWFIALGKFQSSIEKETLE